MSRLYVGNVPSTLKTEELRSLFEDCGKIKYFNIQEGSGYMEYETAEAAEEAIKKLNGKQFENTSLIVEPSRKIFPKKKIYNIKPKRYRPPSSRSNSSRRYDRSPPYSNSKHRHRRRRYHSRSYSRGSRSRSRTYSR